MSPELIFSIGTLATWAGWTLVLRALYLGLRLLSNAPGSDRPPIQRGAIIAAGLAAVLLLIGRLSPGEVGREIEGTGVRIPVVWFYTQFWGWMIVAALAFTLAHAIQAFLAITQEERKTKLIWCAGWAGFGVLSISLFRFFQGQVTVFRGAFYLQPTTIGVLAIVATLALFLMAFSARRATSRTKNKNVITHFVLLLGCFVFGLPFAWLLSSSFKEDRDMSGGIVWIPKVTETADYLDPRDPLYEGQFEGMAVRASKIETLPDGALRLDVIQPFSMRGRTFEAPLSELTEVPKKVPVVTGIIDSTPFKGKVVQELADGSRQVQILQPDSLKDQVQTFAAASVQESRPHGLRVQNYPEALQYLPPETQFGLVYLKNTLILVVLSVIGTILSCAIVAYAFSRMRFPGREFLFKILLATMMLPGAVTLMPQFLIFKNLGWVDTLYPLWVPAFFAGAFNVFMLRQFFNQIPMELEDAAKIDGCSYLRAFWTVMLPQVKPALAVIAIWTFMGTWNNFMGPLIYINSPENMPIAYALQLFNGERGGEPGLLMAFATLTMLPVLAVFFFAQKYFIEGVTLSGLGGR